MSQTRILLYFLVTTIAIVLWTKYRKSDDVEVPIIKAPIGDISGMSMVTRHGRDIFAYKGIPYAQPPIGRLRFKRPQPFKDGSAWQGVFKAEKLAQKCVQISPIDGSTEGSENCLQLNVYVPKRESKTQGKLPVMVWIHGGGFMTGDSTEELYGPGALLDKDVILVAMNYRLNILGFLNLGSDDEASGNQGLWDQHEAIKWVQKNIEAFGGDANRVTVFGESAGGWSVTSQVASKVNKGLFHAAIIQSGGIDQPFLNFDKHRNMPEMHLEFAQKVGCSNVKCLQEKSLEDLYAQFFMFDQCQFQWELPSPLIWTPSDDSKLSKFPFFAQHPRQMLESGDFNVVPMMMGETRDEGLVFMAGLEFDQDKLKMFNDNLDECLALHMLGEYFHQTLPSNVQAKIDKLKQFYLHGNAINVQDWTFRNLSKMNTDGAMIRAGEIQVRQFAKKTPAYYYQLDFLGTTSVLDFYGKSTMQILIDMLKKVLGLKPKAIGVGHADDLLYLFTNVLNGLQTEEEAKMSDFMVELWTNFAIHHNPTPVDNAWPAYGVGGTTYVRLDTKLVFELDAEREKRQQFWRDL